MTTGESQERKYRLEKGQNGEWELLGNDGETLWRIYPYDEVNTGARGMSMSEVRLWGLRYQKKPLGMWVKYRDGYPRRKDAVEAIMKKETK